MKLAVAIAFFLFASTSGNWGNSYANPRVGSGIEVPGGLSRTTPPSGPPPKVVAPEPQTPKVTAPEPNASPGRLIDSATDARRGIDEAKKVGDHNTANTLGAQARKADADAAVRKKNLDEMAIKANSSKLAPYDKSKAELRINHVYEDSSRVAAMEAKLGVKGKDALSRKLDQIESNPDLFVSRGEKSVSGKYIDGKGGVIAIRAPYDLKNGGTAWSCLSP